LTIYTVGAKNACYEALSNMNALAQLASETKSGWGFHVTVMTDHVKNAMSKLESSPAQAGEYLSRAIDTLGMLRKIDPVRLNDNQKGSFKQLIGYVAKSLRDARANIKVVTTASRPGVKAKFAKWESTLTKKHGKPIEEYTARLKGGLFMIEVAEGTDGPYAVLYRWDDLRGAQRIASGNLQSLMRQAESMGAKEARGVAAIERISNYSRPGAKAK